MEHSSLQIAAWLRESGPARADVPTTADAWSALADRVCREGLAGLVQQNAANLEIALPSPLAARLRETAMAMAAENLHAFTELEGVVKAFNTAKIPVMLLKGAALNLTVYDRLDLRPMSDVDLLVRPETGDQAVQFLEEHGCRRGADLLREDFFPRYHYELELFTGSSRPARIDLHVRPFRPLRLSRIIPDDGLWHGAQTIRIGRAQAMVPCPSRMLLQLAGHAAFHGNTRLLWLYDIRRVVEHAQGSLDWAQFVRCAQLWRLSLPVLRALERARVLFGPVCPAAVIDELRSHRVSWRDRLTLAHAPRDAASPVAHFLVSLLCTPGFRFNLGYGRAVLFPAAEHLAQSYPFRHWGWVPTAQAWRSLRAAWRLMRVHVG